MSALLARVVVAEVALVLDATAVVLVVGAAAAVLVVDDLEAEEEREAAPGSSGPGAATADELGDS